MLSQQSRIEATLANNTAVLSEYKSLKIIQLEYKIRGEAKPALKVWRGRQSRPYINTFYRDEAALVRALVVIKAGEDALDISKTARKVGRTPTVNNLRLDDIVAVVWGYEQTNANFYQVIETKGLTVQLREVNGLETSDGVTSMTGSVVALQNQFVSDEVLTKRVTGKEGNAVSLRYGYGFKWDGRPISVSHYA